MGLIWEVLLEEGVCCYDVNVEFYYYFCCCYCGVIEDVDWEELLVVDLGKFRVGFKVECYEIIVYGVCENCGD